MTTLKDAATPHDDEIDEVNEADEVDAVELETSAEEQVPDKESTTEDETAQKRPIVWKRVFAYGVLPALALTVALAAGYLKWLGGSAQDSAALRAETVRIGSEDAVALL